jgi:RNA-splicing ligase RtcB
MSIRIIGDPPTPATGDLRVFESDGARADAGALEQLRNGIAGIDLAAPAVVLPDFHHKSKLEMPSSITVATRETIRPTFTSASVNCGMALIALNVDRPSEAAIASFYRSVMERYPFPPTRRREMSTNDVLRCAAEGARFAAERTGVDASDLDAVEERGTLDLSPYGNDDRLRKELPRLLRFLASMRFGTIGPRNHFIEIQQVEEVLDARAARLLGLSKGQITMQFHAGGGVLTGEIGAMFGRRKHYPARLRTVMSVQKPLIHLARARSIEQLRTRLSLYFGDGCPPVPRYSEEGERVMLANAAAMNYGFAFRLTTYAALRKLAANAFGGDGSRLVVDSPHNSIYEEAVDGGVGIVHRHNSCRAFPPSRMTHHPIFGITGQPVLLPGTDRTSSFLCVSEEGSSASLHSACHGAGTMIADFEKRGISKSDRRKRSTLKFSYDGAAPVAVPQLDDRGVYEALNILRSNGLVRPVVRLRPIAVLN